MFDAERAKSIPVELRIRAAEALGQAGDPRLADEGQRWVEIPGGQFWMGAQKTDLEAPGYDDEAFVAEAPPHRVRVSPFRMGRWPVTVWEYELFLDDGGYADPRWWEAGGQGEWTAPDNWEDQLQYPNRPVRYLSWYEASAYCAWLTRRRQATGLAASPNEEVRLATEAEWELAVRGTEGRRYPWGEEGPGPELANFAMNIGDPTPVGIYPAGATPEGVLDLAGNVWEWCRDSGDDKYYRHCHDQGTVTDPTGADAAAGPRVLRGGAFVSRAGDLRATNRFRVRPENRYWNIGLRCVLAPRRQP